MKKLLSILTGAIWLAGCGVPSPAPGGAGGENAILSFSISDPRADGTIDREAGSITVEVPAGTPLVSLVAVFTTSGEAVSVLGTPQESGVTENDFTDPVTYDVKAADGSAASYLVSVRAAPPLSAGKEITSFSIVEPAAVGRIDQPGHAIAVTVPHGTDVSALVTVFATTGALVTVDDTEQESRVTVNDFTDPLTYLVTAEDGSTARYVVTVTQAPGTEKSITAFSIREPAAAGSIDQDARIIRVRVPEGTDLSMLVAEFAGTGASVNVGGTPQVNGVTANDFAEPVSYVVAAEDGSTAVYIVRVVAAIGLLINELDVDQVGTDTAEFIELYARAEVDPAGLVLVLLNGSAAPGVEYGRVELAPAGSVPGNTFLVVAGPLVNVAAAAMKLTPASWQSSNRIQNGPADAVMLYDTLGHRVVDTVSYSGTLHRALVTGEAGELDATEGAAGAPSDSNGTPGSLGRIPDVQDTNQNGDDFRFMPVPTPGAPNDPGS